LSGKPRTEKKKRQKRIEGKNAVCPGKKKKTVDVWGRRGVFPARAPKREHFLREATGRGGHRGKGDGTRRICLTGKES